jgi:hypothetical protein
MLAGGRKRAALRLLVVQLHEPGDHGRCPVKDLVAGCVFPVLPSGLAA